MNFFGGGAGFFRRKTVFTAYPIALVQLSLCDRFLPERRDFSRNLFAYADVLKRLCGKSSNTLHLTPYLCN